MVGTEANTVRPSRISGFGTLEQSFGFPAEQASLASSEVNISAAGVGSHTVLLQKETQQNLTSVSGSHRENWGETSMAEASPRTDTSTDDTDDRNQRFEKGQSAATVASDSSDKSKEKAGDQKAYVQQLESSRLKLTQLEQELQRARQQGIFISSTGDQSHSMSGNGALAFDVEYARWLEEHNRQISELRAAVNSHAGDTELRTIVDNVIAQFNDIFRLKGIAAKADVFHILSGMWKTPAERCFMWLGGFRSSELLKLLVTQLEPLTEQQLVGIYNLQQSSQQAEDALSQGMEALQQSLAETLANGNPGSSGSSGNMANYMGQMAMAMGKLGTLEGFLRQTANTRTDAPYINDPSISPCSAGSKRLFLQASSFEFSLAGSTTGITRRKPVIVIHLLLRGRAIMAALSSSTSITSPLPPTPSCFHSSPSSVSRASLPFKQPRFHTFPPIRALVPARAFVSSTVDAESREDTSSPNPASNAYSSDQIQILDNAVDEAQAGHASKIDVVLHSDNSVSITDNGRGIPTDLHPVTKKSALETVLTVLHAGGKFGGSNSGYTVSGGLHGVGLSVVNALSEGLDVSVWRDTKEYRQKYSRGNPVTPLTCLDLPSESMDLKGTRIRFWPDKEVFTTEIQFDYSTIAGRVRELAFLNPKITITLRKEDTDPEKAQYDEFFYSGGLVEYVSWLNTDKDKDVSLSGEHVREGLTCIVSVKVPSPEFEGQTKTRLGNPEVRKVVDQSVQEYLTEYLELHPQVLESILSKALNALKAAQAAKSARELVRRKSVLKSSSLPGKLADCSSTNPEESGGSAKQGRDRRFQAILPLRGKILNIERRDESAMYKNEEIQNLILGLGLGVKGEDFNKASLRYHKIIILTDADVDGAHIRTLLLTFFYRYQNLKSFKVPSLKMHPTISRGLGEMMPAQLWETTMDPERRLLKQLVVEDAAKANVVFSSLMGTRVDVRKELLQNAARMIDIDQLDI
ncbi:hypothetical protein Tsubulata_003570 [Turnera subulata]|uniref:DNA topoisomerase 2 n=1 Tax=Turnera subulata TaxID=218843 RepID=A0A9Q0GBM9_9ROSI|nr:hypothetical protein Tsubulata_003570 [Turnera subulata]